MALPSLVDLGIPETIAADAWRVVEAIVITVVGVLAALFIRANMRRALSPRLPPYVYKPLENLVFYSVIFIAVVTALRPFGINLSSLLVAGGLASIVIGLAAQNTLADVISGLFLLMEQPIRVGDPVMLENVAGEVVDIRVLSTLIRTWDGHLVRIPNKKVFDSVIVNFSRTRARRIDFTVGISYDSSIDDAINALRGLVDDSPYCLLSPQPEIYVDEYADSSIVIRVRCWTPTRLWYPAKMDLQTRVREALERAGVKIPFPQLDLHVRTSEPVFRVSLEDNRENRRGAK